MTVKYIDSYRILHDDAQVLICPTNAGGVMGAGLAKVFREQIPGLFTQYKAHCEHHDPVDMVPFVYPFNGQQIYCLHTKRKFWEASTLAIIEDGIAKLLEWCLTEEIKSVAMPALGCGRGGLKFEDVQPLLERLLSSSEVEFRLYHRS